MSEYSEPEKIKSRELVITEAIKCLTESRTSATLTRRSYVREVQAQLLKQSKYDRDEASKLSIDTIDRWEKFYDSITQIRKPENLKIAYFAGPNPENDLRIFCKLGVLPENIWAFESDEETYLSAVGAALASEFPFIKIINANIEAFLLASPQRFDIVYLDFCGPIPSRNKKQRTLAVMTSVLANHVLNSPGILITNAALPDKEQDPEGVRLLAQLVGCYLYPKAFLEPSGEGDITDGPITNGLDFDDFLKAVFSNLEDYYGQFISRLIMDHASVIVPYGHFPRENQLFKKLFEVNNQAALQSQIAGLFHFGADGDGGVVISDSGDFPILWTFGSLLASLNLNDVNYPSLVLSDEKFREMAGQFVRELNTSKNEKITVANVSQLMYLLSEGEGQNNYLSKPLRTIASEHEFGSYYQFCDVVLFHQILELLFRQLAVPYHVNVQQTKRWIYKAKKTRMFLDMTVLDECRYVYDWMPTLDMIAKGFQDKNRQLAYRFALDGINKHRRWYNNEYFYGTAIVDQFTAPFEVKSLSRREIIS